MPPSPTADVFNNECALCSGKSKHRAGNDKGVPLRTLPQPGFC